MFKVEEFTLESVCEEDILLHGYLYHPEVAPRAILLHVHGMAEHGRRYAELAEFFAARGFLVVIYDQRGFGMTGRHSKSLGHFSDEAGWHKKVDDLHTLVNWVSEPYPDLKVFIKGHSMGSFTVQSYLWKYGTSFDAAILGASMAPYPKAFSRLGQGILKPMIAKYGPRKVIKGIHRVLLGPDENRSRFKSSDMREIEKFIQDPLTNTKLSLQGWHDVLEGLVLNRQANHLRKIPKHMPIRLIAGSRDPLGLFGMRVRSLEKLYKKHGIENVSSKIYAGEGHELLHGLQKQQVMQELLEWIEQHL